MVEFNLQIYSSSDMKAGLDMAMSEARASLLTKCVGVDPRGCIFTQTSMEGGLADALQATGKVEAFTKASAEGGALQEFTGPTTFKDSVALVSYKVRVMLAHVRDQFDRGHAISDALLEIFAIMTTTQKKAGSIRSINRSHRLARENPFKHFRDSPSPSPSPVGDEEEPTVIIKY